MKHVLLAIAAIFFGFSTSIAQDLEKKWQFNVIQNSSGEDLFQVNQKSDVLELKNGEFSYSVESKNLKASGDYIHQNNLLVFYYNQPNDTIRRYKIKEHTDSTLVFQKKIQTFTLQHLKKKKLLQ